MEVSHLISADGRGRPFGERLVESLRAAQVAQCSDSLRQNTTSILNADQVAPAARFAEAHRTQVEGHLTDKQAKKHQSIETHRILESTCYRHIDGVVISWVKTLAANL